MGRIAVAYPGRAGAHSAAACDRLFPAAEPVRPASFTEVVAAAVAGSELSEVRALTRELRTSGSYPAAFPSERRSPRAPAPARP